MAESYEREKLGNAVNALATSAAPIQKRLEYAWLAMHTMINHGFTDPERQAEFAEINERLRPDKSDPHAGDVPTTCARLSEDEATKIAQAIVDLNTRLHHDRIYALEDEIRDLRRR
jgi:hypothetical protein